MKKIYKFIILVIVLIAIIFFVNLFINRDKVDTYMEERLQYAMDYTNKNYEDLEASQEPLKLIAEQDQMLTDLKAEYESGDYTAEEPFIAVDPVQSNNLAAIVAFDSEQAVSYSYTVLAKGDDGYPFTYTNDSEQKGTIMIPVVGLYSDYNNQVELTVNGTTTTLEIQTTKADDKYMQGGSTAEELAKEAGIVIDDETAAKMTGDSLLGDEAVVETEIVDDAIFDYADGFILSEAYDIYDFNGELRFSAEPAADNSSLKFNDGRFLVLGRNDVIYEKDLFGRIYNYYIPPQSDENNEAYTFHHDFEVVGDSIYVLSGGKDIDKIDDNEDFAINRETIILKMDRETGHYQKAFDMDYYFEGEPQSNVLPINDQDPIHLNSIVYYEDADQLILSAKNQSFVIGVDPDNGKLLWQLKDPSGVTEKTEKYNLENINPDTMIYPSGNHSAFVMNTEKYNSEGNDLYISLFDNKNCLNEDGTPQFYNIGEEPTCTNTDVEPSSMLIYHIDLSAMTVETVEEIIPDTAEWSYIRSSVFTNIEGIYSMNYAETTINGVNFAHSTLYVTDTDGNLLTTTSFDGLSNIYRSRLINEDELSIMLDLMSDTLFDGIE